MKHIVKVNKLSVTYTKKANAHALAFISHTY